MKRKGKGLVVRLHLKQPNTAVQMSMYEWKEKEDVHPKLLSICHKYDSISYTSFHIIYRQTIYLSYYYCPS